MDYYYAAYGFWLRFWSNADELNSTDRVIVFTVFDGLFSGSDDVTLQITTINDNPTTVST